MVGVRCSRCGAEIREVAPQTLEIEVIHNACTVERRTFYALHPSCAAVKQRLICSFTAKRYARRLGVEVRSRIAAAGEGAGPDPIVSGGEAGPGAERRYRR